MPVTPRRRTSTTTYASRANEKKVQDGRGHGTHCVGTSCGPVGAVDLTGPGFDVYSSWPMPLRYKRNSGTSMATPHAAGVAAGIAQATGARGLELWARLSQFARRLPLPGTDVGAGLRQAP